MKFAQAVLTGGMCWLTASLTAASNASNSIAELGATNVLTDDGGCTALCDATGACANDPNFHGSYCKFWQTPAVCFGSVSLCFQPNDSGCDDAALPPVTCPAQTNTTCTLLCSQTASCVNDPKKSGSFCKTESGVCFGLYWTDASRTSACYEPNDPNCPASFPVPCTGPALSTTSLPGSGTSASSITTSPQATTETPGNVTFPNTSTIAPTTTPSAPITISTTPEASTTGSQGTTSELVTNPSV